LHGGGAKPRGGTPEGKKIQRLACASIKHELLEKMAQGVDRKKNSTPKSVMYQGNPRLVIRRGAKHVAPRGGEKARSTGGEGSFTGENVCSPAKYTVRARRGGGNGEQVRLGSVGRLRKGGRGMVSRGKGSQMSKGTSEPLRLRILQRKNKKREIEVHKSSGLKSGKGEKVETFSFGRDRWGVREGARRRWEKSAARPCRCRMKTKYSVVERSTRLAAKDSNSQRGGPWGRRSAFLLHREK